MRGRTPCGSNAPGLPVWVVTRGMEPGDVMMVSCGCGGTSSPNWGLRPGGLLS